MRYSKDEESILVGMLPEGLDNVTIEVLNLKTDTVMDLTDNRCVESSKFPGVYIWSTNNMAAANTNGYINLLYRMTGITTTGKPITYYGKFVYSGYVDEKANVDLTPVLDNQEEIIDTVDIINARI